MKSETVVALVILAFSGTIVVTQSCAPTRAQVEQSEDQFCATVASARKAEAAFGLLPDAGK